MVGVSEEVLGIFLEVFASLVKSSLRFIEALTKMRAFLNSHSWL